jgi:hypothetical protein
MAHRSSPLAKKSTNLNWTSKDVLPLRLVLLQIWQLCYGTVWILSASATFAISGASAAIVELVQSTDQLWFPA